METHAAGSELALQREWAPLCGWTAVLSQFSCAPLGALMGLPQDALWESCGYVSAAGV